MATVRIKEECSRQEFTVKVQISPLPRNCLDCPFYQYQGEGEYGEGIFNCLLTDMKDKFGIAVRRYAGCPFNKKEEK